LSSAITGIERESATNIAEILLIFILAYLLEIFNGNCFKNRGELSRGEMTQ